MSAPGRTIAAADSNACGVAPASEKPAVCGVEAGVPQRSGGSIDRPAGSTDQAELISSVAFVSVFAPSRCHRQQRGLEFRSQRCGVLGLIPRKICGFPKVFREIIQLPGLFF
jgi:hypothetical protein